jgi:site-specific recombinase XerC
MTDTAIPKISLTLRHQKYSYSFRHDGTRIRGTTGVGNKMEAMIIAQRELIAYLRQCKSQGETPFGLRPAIEAMNDFIVRKTQHNKHGRPSSESTLTNMRNFRDRFIEYFGIKVTLEILTKREIEDWMFWLTKQPVGIKGRTGTLSKKTVKEHMIFLGSIYREYQITPNPVSNIRLPDKSNADRVENLRFYQPEDIAKLMNATDDLANEEVRNTPIIGKTITGQYIGESTLTSCWNQFYSWFRMMIWTGIRLGEMQGIRFKDLNHELKKIRVISEKTKDTRTIKLQGGKTIN